MSNDSTAQEDNIISTQESGDPPFQNESSTSAESFIFWDGNIGPPAGRVAKTFQEMTIEDQQRRTEEMFKKLCDPDFHPALLNLDPTIIPVIAHMPGPGRRVRVFHGLGTPATQGTRRDENCFIFALHGEQVDDVSTPRAYQLPPEILDFTKFKLPAVDKFEKAMKEVKEGTVKNTAFKAGNLRLSTPDISAVAAVPPYLVYDIFGRDIDCLILYERLKEAARDETSLCKGALNRALDFVKLGFVSTTLKDNNPMLPYDCFLAPESDEAAQWRSIRVKCLYPPPNLFASREDEATEIPAEPEKALSSDDESIKVTGVEQPHTPRTRNNSEDSTASPAPAQPTPYKPTRPTATFFEREEAAAGVPPPVQHTQPAPPLAQPTVPPQNPQVITLTEDMFRRLWEAAGKSATATTLPKVAEPELDATFGLPRSAFDTLLGMCGLARGLEGEIPTLWKKLGEKKLETSDKYRIIKFALQSEIKHKTCKVPGLHAVVKMICKRDFEGEVSISSLACAVKGLSPFALPFLTEAQVDAHNELATSIEEASSTTVKDVSGNKLKCTVPPTFETLVKQIKRFSNLLFACFGESSPMFLATEEVIDELEYYNDTAQANLNKQSFASILWILMLQARHFAAGLMHGQNGTISAFANMLVELRTRQNVQHGDVPVELFRVQPPPTPSNPRDNSWGSEYVPPTKRQRQQTGPSRQDRGGIYSAKMREAMSPFMAMQPRPSVGQLCRAANTHGRNLFPATPNACIRAQLWGACNSDCDKDHIRLPPAAIDAAIQKLGPVIANPSRVHQQV